MKKELWKTLIFSFSMLVAVTVFMAGCSQPGEDATEQESTSAALDTDAEPYKIGAILSVTGGASFLGDPEKKTLEMLEKQVNASGGIDGVPIELIIEDDAGDAAKAKNAAMRLIDKEEVLAILGPSTSGNSLAIKELATTKEVPLISCAAAEKIVDPLSPWVFKTPQKDSYVIEHLLGYMQENGISKVAMLYGNTGFGQNGLQQLKKYHQKYNVEILHELAYSPKATDSDIVTLLTKVKKDQNVQAIVNWSVFPPQSVVPKKMKELEMDDIQLFHSHGFGNIKYVEQAGDAADGIIFPCGRLIVAEKLPDDNPQKENLVEYKQAYESTYNEDVSTFGGHAYDAFWITVNALKKSGPDRAKLREEIEKTSGFAGTGGVFNMTAEDHNGLTMDSLELLTVRDSEFDLLNK